MGKLPFLAIERDGGGASIRILSKIQKGQSAVNFGFGTNCEGRGHYWRQPLPSWRDRLPKVARLRLPLAIVVRSWSCPARSNRPASGAT